MPNFNTHWLVAANLVETYPDSLPAYITRGYFKYKNFAQSEAEKIKDVVADVVRNNRFIRGISMLDTAIDAVYARLANHRFRDDMTCFSAYCLGACGPDFWTLPTVSSGVPPMAEIHFDLGHYNRTHRQFDVAIRRWRGADNLQQKVEKSYYYGMATHIAADLVIHQLVNVYAGAYNLLNKTWTNEHGMLPARIWSTHNKVEHYWDSYVRYRYFGDIERPYGDDEPSAIMSEPFGWPTTYGLIAYVASLGRQNTASVQIVNHLSSPSVKYRLERMQNLPHLACDRMLAGDVTPFIYQVAVNKRSGAYPTNEIFPEAGVEARSGQMQDSGFAGLTEMTKVRFFSTGRNSGMLPDRDSSNNYLTYFICPNLDRLRQHGADAFFDPNALPPYVRSAVSAAKTLANALTSGIRRGTVKNTKLGLFWNLDTGLGLRVENGRAEFRGEVITKLHFVNIFEELRGGTGYRGGNGYRQAWTARAFNNPSPGAPFPIYPGPEFDGLGSIQDRDQDSYLARIEMRNPDMVTTPLTEESFFTCIGPATGESVEAPTTGMEPLTSVQHQDFKHRLTLQIDAPIAKIGSDKNAFYLYGDDRKNIADRVTHAVYHVSTTTSTVVATRTWLDRRTTRIIDFFESDSEDRELEIEDRQSLFHFRPEVLINLERETNCTREIQPGRWNNVIEHAKHRRHYCRNYAIGTGRPGVSFVNGRGNFDPAAHFQYYSNVSPTEQVFFSLYVLVHGPDDRVYDAISKEEVSSETYNNVIKRIDSLGFVKIVLLYHLSGAGVVQLSECYIDGLKCDVH